MTTPPAGIGNAPPAAAPAASPFAVTAPPDLVLSPDRSGATSFTVTNLTGRPVRARLTPKGETAAVDCWLAVAGEPEVPMTIGSTITVNVHVLVPPEVAVGEHTLRLEVVAEDDTETVSGQSVAFSVPAPVITKNRQIPWLVVIIALVVLLAGGVGAILLTRKPGPPVNAAPPLITGTPTVGQVLTSSTGLWTGDTISFSFQWASCQGDGSLCGPIAGATQQTFQLTAAETGRLVGVFIIAHNPGGDTGPVASAKVGPVGGGVIEPNKVDVPQFIGLTEPEADALARASGLQITFQVGRLVRGCPERVLGQSPVAGAQLSPTEPVILVISRSLQPFCNSSPSRVR